MKSLTGLGGILFATSPALKAEIDSEIPLGIEAVTGIRSHYVHRGFQLADSSLDFQLEAEVTLSNDTSLHLGLSHLAESEGDFSETTGYLELGHSFTKQFTLGTTMTYLDRDAGILDSGLDLGIFSSFSIDDKWLWRNELNFDFSENGIYLASELEWSHVISDKSFVTIKGGLSYVSDYLDRDGLNDFYARVAFTHALSDQVSFTPFFGSSFQLDDGDASDVSFGGLSFEVIF